MAGVHGLQHVEGFLAAALTEDHAVGPHTQRVLDQIALANFTLAFDVGWTRLHAPDMRLLQLQFGRVLNRDQSFIGTDGRRQRIQSYNFV